MASQVAFKDLNMLLNPILPNILRSFRALLKQPSDCLQRTLLLTIVLTLERAQKELQLWIKGSQCSGWENKNQRPLDIWLLNKQILQKTGEHQGKERRKTDNLASTDLERGWVAGQSTHVQTFVRSCTSVLPFLSREGI